MIFYVIVIWGADAIILFLNMVFCRDFLTVREICMVTLLMPFGLIAIDGLAAFLVRYTLPKKWFDHKVKFHVASKKECVLYEKLGIKAWKDHILELGMFTSFSKKSVREQNAGYIERFILECNYGVWGHLAGIVLGFVPVICLPQKYLLTIILPGAYVNAFLSLLPLLILRYNVPRLQRMLAVLQKREAE